jgi:hypothetical protein
LTTLSGDYFADIVTLALPDDAVRRMLPCGLELGPQTVTPAGQHPVMFAMGRHRDVTMPLLGWTPGFPLNYQELFVVVPALRRPCALGSYKGPFLYPPRLYLDNLQAVLGGELIWGMAKLPARIAQDETSFAVARLIDGAPMLSLASRIAGAYGPVASQPNFAPLAALLSQRMINKALLGLGCYLGATMDWGWSRAVLRPVATVLDIAQAFIPGLPVGRFAAPGIDADPLGSAQVRTHWELTLPYPPALCAACAPVPRTP